MFSEKTGASFCSNLLYGLLTKLAVYSGHDITSDGEAPVLKIWRV